jgi:hypothetical protein
MTCGGDLGRRRYEHTLDRGMGVGEYSPIPTIRVEVFDAVPSGAIDVDRCRLQCLIGRTPDLRVVDDLASQSKNELSFDSSSLTEVREASTSNFHMERHLSNEVAANSSTVMRCSRWRSFDLNLEKHMLMMESCTEKPSCFWSCICLTNSSMRSLMLGSMSPIFF